MSLSSVYESSYRAAEWNARSGADVCGSLVHASVAKSSIHCSLLTSYAVGWATYPPYTRSRPASCTIEWPYLGPSHSPGGAEAALRTHLVGYWSSHTSCRRAVALFPDPCDPPCVPPNTNMELPSVAAAWPCRGGGAAPPCCSESGSQYRVDQSYLYDASLHDVPPSGSAKRSGAGPHMPPKSTMDVDNRATVAYALGGAAPGRSVTRVHCRWSNP
mmetsp:Transcript_22397/g.76065  ORF Transcript_22397/g.76065 Transcript_22397/m.76065 type:complete len:216 (-) Transcript_22397:154-801(-)